MVEPTDMTLDVLRKIQDGIVELRDDVRENSRRLGGVEQRLGGVEQRLDEQGRLLEAHGRRIGALEARTQGVEARLHELVEVTTLSVTRQLDLARRVDLIEGRVTALETR